MALSPFLKGAARFFSGPRMDAEPRKGLKAFHTQKLTDVTDGHLTRDKILALPSRQYRSIAERDDIICAIRRTLRMGIGELPWKIVPDIDAVKADLKRWQTVTELSLAGIEVPFLPETLEPVFFAKAQLALRELLQSEMAAGEEDFQSNTKLRQFFDNCISAHSVIAESHISRVKDLLEMPEPTDPKKTFRSLLDYMIDDLTLFDQTGIVKNTDVTGTRLAEMYALPGDEIRVYQRSDRATPVPPHIAYDWSSNDKIRAVFNSAELMFYSVNPQLDGYGKSPLDSILSLMMNSLFADAYMGDFFQNNNVPRGMFDLGPNVDQAERDAVEKRFNQQARLGLRRIVFVSNHENVKGFIPMPTDSNKDSQILESQQKWAARKCAVYGLNLGDIGFTEDLHRTTSETQQDISQSRGFNSFSTVIQSNLNTGIVKGMMWARNDPENPLDLTGKLVPIFPFNDVRFEFITKSEDLNKDDVASEVSQVKAGIYSINEVRKKHGDAPIAGGDIHVNWDGGFVKISDVKDLPSKPPGGGGDDADQDKPVGGDVGGGKPKPDGAADEKSTGTLESLAKRLADSIPS